mmetsp:Transcript_22908/g.48749  ORF Transcript_22908/g.48749 Transcript_22908/m.48749 type:complete len:83 (+) Transcript_22908:1158-1406(+)
MNYFHEFTYGGTKQPANVWMHEWKLREIDMNHRMLIGRFVRCFFGGRSIRGHVVLLVSCRGNGSFLATNERIEYFTTREGVN